MSYADELASSDPPEETGTEQPVAAVNETGDTIVDQETNDGFNCDTELRSHGNSRQSSLSQRAYSRSPSIGSTTSSLGRRSREIGPGYFSHREKVHIREFTQEKCTEYELPPNERAIIMQNSELSTHELLVVFMCKMAQTKNFGHDDAFNAYLKSPKFNENVVLKLKTMLLDANISSYKAGVLERVMRHIRLNPNQYKIPPEHRELITSAAFAAAVSKALTNARSVMKAKLKVAWAAQSDIYSVVKELSPKATHEPSEEIWARWAWVHLMHSDFSNVIKQDGSKYNEKDFWDWLDNELKSCRERHENIDSQERTRKINALFKRFLSRHKSKFPPKVKPHTGQTPSWQQAVARSVIIMEEYTVEDLTEQPVPISGEDEQRGEFDTDVTSTAL